MQNHAKSKVLQSIIDMMDSKMLGGLKKKGQPAALAIEVHGDKDDSAPDPLAEAKEGAHGDEQGEDQDMLRQLMEMYSKNEQDEGDDKDSPVC